MSLVQRVQTLRRNLSKKKKKCKFGCTSFSPLSLFLLFSFSLSILNLAGFPFYVVNLSFLRVFNFFFFGLSNLLDLGFCKINVISFRSKIPKTKVD